MIRLTKCLLTSNVTLQKLRYSTIMIHKYKENIAVVELNRPKKKNAFSKKMYEDLGNALKSLSTDESVRVILLTGNGDFYSSGNDLSNFSRLMHPLTTASHAAKMCEVFVNSFIDCEKPIVCAVNGPAIGIAATTLGLVDHVISTERATFHTPFAALGQYPEGCSTAMFPRIMGEAAATDFLDRGKVFSAKDALTVGLVHEICTFEDLRPRALTYCSTLASAVTEDTPPRQLRRIVREGLRDTLHVVNAREMKECEQAWICHASFEKLSNYLSSRNMIAASLILRFANLTGPLWGQPKWKSDRL